MLKNKLLPNTQKHIKNFQLDYPTRKKLMVAAMVLQTISLVSGGYGLTPFLQQLAAELLPVQYSAVGGSALGFSIAFAVEYLVYVLISYIVFVIPTDYLKEEETVAKVYGYIQFFGSCLLLVGLVAFSMFISKKAVKLQIEATQFHTFDYSKFDLKEEVRVGKVNDVYRSDLSHLEKKRNSTAESINKSKEAKINAIEAEKSLILRSEEKSGKRYTTKKLLLSKQIASIEEEAAAELRRMNDRYDNEAAKLRTSKEGSIARITSTISENKGIAMKEEGRVARAKEEQKVFVSMLLTYISQFSVVGAVICLLWCKMSEVRSGQEQRTFALPENFQSKWYYELYVLITLTPTRWIQNLTRKGLLKVPDLIQLEEVGAIVPIAVDGVRKNEIEKPGQSTDSINSKNATKAVKDEKVVKVKKEHFAPTTEQLNLILSTSNLSDRNGSISATVETPIKTRKTRKRGANMPKSDMSAYVLAQKESVRNGYTELLKIGKKKPKIKEVSAAIGIGEKTVSKYLKILRAEGAV